MGLLYLFLYLYILLYQTVMKLCESLDLCGSDTGTIIFLWALSVVWFPLICKELTELCVTYIYSFKDFLEHANLNKFLHDGISGN